MILADERLKELKETNVIVSSDGTVEWSPVAIYKSNCAVKITYFPYDIQRCHLKFGPWAHTGFALNMTFFNNYEDVFMGEKLTGGEWDVKLTYALFTEKSYECCPDTYPDITFYIWLKRRSDMFAYLLIAPCFLLSSLTLVIFWLPPDTPAKMVLGMNIFVAFFLLLLLLKDLSPSAASNFPILGMYYCFNMGTITLSSFLSCIVVNLHYRGDNHAELPDKVKTLMFKFLAPILRVNITPMNLNKTTSGDQIRYDSQTDLKNVITVIRNANITVSNPNLITSLKKNMNQIQNSYEMQDLVSINISNDLSNHVPNLSNSGFNPSNNFLDTHNKQKEPRFSQNNFYQTDYDTPYLAQQPIRPSHPEGCVICSANDHNQRNRATLVNPKNFYSQSWFNDAPTVSAKGVEPMLVSMASIDSKECWCHQLKKQNLYRNPVTITRQYQTPESVPIMRRMVTSDMRYSQRNSAVATNDNFHNRIPKNTISNGTQSPKCLCYGCINEREVKTGKKKGLNMAIISTDVHDICIALNFIRTINEHKRRIARITDEWREFGLVLDRVFFVSYLMAIIISLIVFFVVSGMDELSFEGLDKQKEKILKKLGRKINFPG